MQVSDACLASQNARRLAKLSLSYSNRWLRHFDATHEAALIALSAQKQVRQTLQTKEQADLFHNLSSNLYS